MSWAGAIRRSSLGPLFASLVHHEWVRLWAWGSLSSCHVGLVAPPSRSASPFAAVSTCQPAAAAGSNVSEKVVSGHSIGDAEGVAVGVGVADGGATS